MGSRKLETRHARRRIYFQYLVLAVSLAFVIGQAGATHNGNHNPGPKGPRASLLSSTTCALNINGASTALEVTNTLTNKSSGEIIPEIKNWVISGTYKQGGSQKGGGGNITTSFDSEDVCLSLGCPVELPVPPMMASFPLCGSMLFVGGQFTARELNGESVVDYGVDSVTNRCTADPVTGEGGGIKIDAATKTAIEEACGP